MIWQWFGNWRRERLAREAETEAKFKALLNEAEDRRGDLTTAVVELREDRERRQAESLRRPRMVSRPEPATQE